jgi:tetratricopeptide (TPR) repeat protein
MRKALLRAGLLCVVLLAVKPVIGAQDAGGAAAKSSRYYRVLLNSPQAGYLFDRFSNAYLDLASMEELEAFLKEQTEEKGASAGLLLGILHAKNSKYAAAIEVLNQVIEAEPGHTLALSQRGDVYLNTLDFEAAIVDFKAVAVGLVPERWEARFTNISDKPIKCFGRVQYNERRAVEVTMLPIRLLRRLVRETIAGLGLTLVFNEKTITLDFAPHVKSLFRLKTLGKTIDFPGNFRYIQLSRLSVDVNNKPISDPTLNATPGPHPAIRVALEFENEGAELEFLGVSFFTPFGLADGSFKTALEAGGIDLSAILSQIGQKCIKGNSHELSSFILIGLQRVANRWFASHPGPTFPNRMCMLTRSTPFLENDHTSILKTMLARFLPNQQHRLGRHVQQAPHLGAL